MLFVEVNSGGTNSSFRVSEFVNLPRANRRLWPLMHRKCAGENWKKRSTKSRCAATSASSRSWPQVDGKQARGLEQIECRNSELQLGAFEEASWQKAAGRHLARDHWSVSEQAPTRRGFESDNKHGSLNTPHDSQEEQAVEWNCR